ncbi:hypothetical protein ACFQ9Z_15935 [Streptomyces sp. NPDC056580]|uniref:hypothetical protein n=1 Tax=Streptomyces sp. NPDC056580 TaxID=3345872 RepID=UPI0036CBD803
MTRTTAQPPATDTAATDATGRHPGHGHDGHTITIPLDSVAHAVQTAVTLPIAAAQRILPAKGGLPLYAGLGALALAGVLEWPVAAGIGIGYAVLRRGGALTPPRPAPQAPAQAATTDNAPASSAEAGSTP